MPKFFAYFLCTFILFHFKVNAQSCNCKNTIQSIITSIEADYAGYHDKIENKISQYKLMKVNLINKSQKIGIFNYDCYKILNEYFDFFDDPHLYTSFNGKQFPDEIRKIFSKNFPVIYPIERENISLKGPLEDYWIDDAKRYTIKIIETRNNRFVGFIIKGDSLFWYKNQIKLELQKAKNNAYKAKYYLRDHTSKNADVLLMNDEIKIGRYARFTRIKIENSFERPKFEFKILNNKFCYLKIPNFLVENIGITDSLMATNKKFIETIPNLIIDLRNNGGGSNITFSKILPFLYTNTFVRDGYSIRSSKNNIKEYINYYNDTTFPQTIRTSFQNIINKLKAQPDTLVEIVASTETKFDSIYANPKKIFLLINEKCASTTEQLIMYAKQSKKVVILGNPTAGSVDYNDINSSTILPCNFLKLYYPMSRSNRVDTIRSKNSRLKPDIELNIPDDKWVEYILNKYN